MKSALLVFVSVAGLASLVGCDDGGDETGGTAGSGPKPVAGSPSTAGTGTTGGSGTGGSGTAGTGTGGALPEGVPLTMMDGWVPGDQNSLGVQGAVFSFADSTSKMGMVDDKTGAKFCISGTAAKVDMASAPCMTKMFTEPGAADCYGQYWGAAIGMNLNQPIDEATKMGGAPMAFDGSSIKGFAFEITGDMVPATLRFKVSTMAGTTETEYCTPSAKPVLLGGNSFMLTDLVTECWKPTAATMNPNAETIKSAMYKISWQVVTKDTMAIPFNFCVTNVRALQ